MAIEVEDVLEGVAQRTEWLFLGCGGATSRRGFLWGAVGWWGRDAVIDDSGRVRLLVVNISHTFQIHHRQTQTCDRLARVSNRWSSFVVSRWAPVMGEPAQRRDPGQARGAGLRRRGRSLGRTTGLVGFRSGWLLKPLAGARKGSRVCAPVEHVVGGFYLVGKSQGECRCV